MHNDDRDSDSDNQLDDLDARLKNAKQGLTPDQEGGFSEASAYSKAMRFLSDMIAGLIIGLAIGIGLDTYLDTKPLFLIIFLFIGVAAGIMNVIRNAKHMNSDVTQGKDDNDN